MSEQLSQELRPDDYIELSALCNFRIFDITNLLKRYVYAARGHTDWQRELVDVAKYAQPKRHTGHNDPTSRMQPGDQPITQYRTPATTVERHPNSRWFNDMSRGPIVELARLAFNMPTLVGAKTTMSLYDFNVAWRPQDGEEISDGEPHCDSETYRASVLCVQGFDHEIVTRYALSPDMPFEKGYIDMMLRPGEISFCRGDIIPHKAIHNDRGLKIGTNAIRATISHGFWAASGEGSFDPERRAIVEKLLY